MALASKYSPKTYIEADRTHPKTITIHQSKTDSSQTTSSSNTTSTFKLDTKNLPQATIPILLMSPTSSKPGKADQSSAFQMLPLQHANTVDFAGSYPSLLRDSGSSRPSLFGTGKPTIMRLSLCISYKKLCYSFWL
jgi:hypothetical protein